jgi:hypothetical protein
VTVWTVVGFVLVIAGSWLVTRRKAPSPGARTAPVVLPEPIGSLSD